LAPPDDPMGALIVEDDADTRSNLCDILELDDWRVETAATAREVLDRDDWSRISIVILDRKLPDGDDQQLLPHIKKVAPGVSVVIVTGFAELDDAILALRKGAADYLLKPINPDALRATLSRLTEQKRVEQALRDSQDRLRQERDFAESLIQTAQTIVLLLDTEGRIIRFNPYFERLSGYPLDEVRGAEWFSIFVPAHQRDLARDYFQSVIAAARVDPYTFPILTRQGIERDVRWSVTTLGDSSRNVTGVLACGQDVTDLNRAQERALQAERLAAIGEMVAGLAHESRNALQRSKACLEMLVLEVEDRPEALDLVARTQRAHDHLSTLYEEVRQYAAPIRLNYEQVNLPALWREVWSHLAVMHVDKEIQLREVADLENLRCCIDRFVFGQVLRNIFENAIQASPQRAHVTIKCAESTTEGRSALRISVADEGQGMTAEQRRRVFEPFFTTKTKGTGLGMAIAQRIVLAHGGSIEVTDQDGPGAEIVVVLPREYE
jgi:PAS domain S-box-containing protein